MRFPQINPMRVVLILVSGLLIICLTATAAAQETLTDANRLNDQVIQLFQAGKYGAAIPLAERALAIRKRLLPHDHPLLAESLNNLALLYVDTGRFEKPESLYLQAAEIYKKNSGNDQSSYCMSLLNLAGFYRKTGRYDQAEQLSLKSIEIIKTSIGQKNSLYGTSLNNLAELYKITSRFDKAEPLFLEASEIYKETDGEDHPNYATSLNNLAVLYHSTGRFDQAEQYYLKALQITKRVRGEEHPEYADTLNSLGHLYRTVGNYEKAESLFQQSAQIRKKVLGEWHPAYADSLSSLASIYADTRQYEKAELFFSQVAEIRKITFGDAHAEYGLSLNNLAVLYYEMQRYDKAEPLLLQAGAIMKKALGTEHHYYTSNLNSLAVLYQAEGQPQKALATLTSSMEIEQVSLQRLFAVSSESAMSAYLSSVNSSLDGLMNILSSERDPSSAELEKALTWVLRRKGMILDALVQLRQAQILIQNDAAVASQAARLRFVRQQMSNLALNRPDTMSDGDFQITIETLRMEGDQLEANLNRRLALERPGLVTTDVDMAILRTKLQTDSALVEFVRADMIDFKAKRREQQWQPAHYFAFVVKAGAQPVRLIDLGPAAVIDQSIREVRARIVEFGDKWKTPGIRLVSEAEQERQFKIVSRNLYEQVFAPVRKDLGMAVNMVYVAPDDQLNLLPFEALVDGKGKYLIEDYRFAYLSSGRDLLRFSNKSAAQATVVFADPDYDMPTAARAQKAEVLLTMLAKNQKTGSNNAQTNASQRASNPYRSAVSDKLRQRTRGQTRTGRWDRLNASAAEAQDVERELKGTNYGTVSVYIKDAALEDVFKQMRSPRLLHISTHGFFPKETLETETNEGETDLSTGSIAVIGQKLLGRTGNPLLQSGLVLAGANTIGDKKTPATPTEVDDGWLTAEEIAMMNLQGTELVVLSACGSGLGTVSAGEGVYGLRRAFQNAGAQTIISTLFEVPDQESGQIMRSFYEGLKNKRSKLDALHEAQLAMIVARRKQESAAHPFFWASFVLTGNPN